MSDAAPRSVELDAGQLKALAHPLRSRLLSALRVYGPATATALAQRLQTNSGATSYHLRQLAMVGLIEEDPEHSEGRQRCWRSAHDFTSWNETRFEDNPDERAASDWLLGHHVRLMTRWIEDWIEARREWPVEWRDAADHSDYEFHLTPDGLTALRDELHQVVRRHQEHADAQHADAQRCTVILHGFPMPEPRL